MRILTVGSLYPPYHLGGYELVWQAAVRALRAAGHEVRVLATDDRLGRPAGAAEDPDVHRELRWYWHDHAFPRLSLGERLGLERHNHAVLRSHLEAFAPDAVSWWSMGGMSLSLIERVRRTGLPAIGFVNDAWPVYGPEVDQWLAGREPGRALAGPIVGVPRAVALTGAARWIFCSEAMRRPTAERLGELTSSAVLHQGVAPVFTAAPPQPWGGRLLYAGRVDERKGVGTLIDAVCALGDCTLRIIGDGNAEVRERLYERARRAGGRIVFEPAVERTALARAYADADAVVFPVEWLEPWGLVPLEAMAVGRPVVATGRGGSGEYLEDGRNALLFEPGDVADLRAAIERLAGDAALRGNLRAGGFETAGRLTEAAWAEAVIAEHEALSAPA